MYGLPKDFDGTFLVGLTLEMICFNASQIYLHFDAQVMITIEGAFSHQRMQSEPGAILDVPVAQSDLMQLLEHRIVSSTWDEAGTLTLEFHNGHVLHCYDSFPNYESYQIKNGEHVTIV